MARKFKRYNNGVVNIVVYEGDPIPEGFTRGTVPWSVEKKKKAAGKRKQTNLQRYGVENPFQSEEIKSKIKETNLKRYGVENPAQSGEVQEKAKKTNLERYGVEHVLQSSEIKKRQEQTTQERYGVENPFRSEEIKEKSKQAMLERYGVENPSQSSIIQEKKKKTSLERYGTEHPMQSEDIKEKCRKTSIERYGTEYPIQSSSIIEKQTETNIERYGVKHPLQLDIIKKKSEETSLLRYGVKNPSQAEEVKSRREKVFIERYGAKSAFESEEIRRKIAETNLRRYGVRNPFQSEEIKEKIESTNLEKYGVPWACMRPEARLGYSNDSEPNTWFASLLIENKISYEREYPIDRYSYDFRVGNTLIELDPFPFHNTLWSPKGEPKDEEYHQRKSRIAESKGFRVIHIFDWNDSEKIVKLLDGRGNVYARKCCIKEVSYEGCTKFLIESHLQNSCRGQEVRLGLFYNKELISIMTFGPSRYNKNYQYELLRYCSSKNVIGGAQKLFTHFIRTYSPKSIISYCDRSKFRGDVYSKLGFTLKSEGKPSCHWYSPKENRHITDNLLRQRGFDQLFDEHYGKGTSNEELIIKRGYVPIYDCGQDTYIWRYSDE